jgi:general secretion pathway protein D
MDKRRNINYLATMVGILMLALLLPLAADARTRKGDRFFRDARTAETQRDYLAAYELYGKALEEDPGDARYQLAFERTRFRVAQVHLQQGRQLRREGKYEEALAAMHKALEVDPSLDVARQEIREIEELREKEQGRADAGDEGVDTKTSEEIAEARRRQVLESLQGPPDIKPISRKPLNLVINNQTPKVIFETIGKLAGINVLFDPAFLQQAGNTRRDLQLVNSSLENALDYAALLTEAFWKPVTENAIFIAKDDPNKRRQYTDWVVKVFYLRNINGAQELTEVANNIRQVTNSRFLFPVPTQNALVVRAERDQVLLIEKLVNDLDKSKPEVVVDVMVFEASRNRTRNLVASFLSGGNNGLSIPIGFTPRSTLAIPGGGTDGDNGGAGATNAIRLGNLSRLSSNDFSVSLPDAVLSALMTDNNTRVIQSPQLRALDGMEASLKVGSQVPIAQGAFSSGIGGGVGGLPFANTQFNFQQVGTEVVMTPRVMGEDDVYLKLRITISSVLERIDVGGVQQPVIGNREISHEVRLRAGEINLIGGLLSQEDTRTLSGTAGLANIPILGRLFSGESIIRRDQDVFIALVPRIIRKFEVDPENSRMISAGTDQVIKLNFAAPVDEDEVAGDDAAPTSPFSTQPVIPGQTPDGTATEPAVLPPAVPDGSAPGVPDGSAPAVPDGSGRGQVEGTRGGRGAGPTGEGPGRGAAGQAARAAAAGGETTIGGQRVGMPEIARMTGPGMPPGGATAVRFSPPGLVVQAGSVFSLALDTQGFQDFKDCQFQLRYPEETLRLREVRPGSLLTAQGERYRVQRETDNGGTSVTITLLEGQEAVSGNGSLVVFQFEAVGAGSAAIEVESLLPRNTEGAAIVQSAPSATIRVQ